MLYENARKQMNNILSSHGTTVTLYSNPTETINEEGDVTLTLGSGTSATCIMFPLDAEEMKWEVEGIDLAESFRCYFSYDTSINKKSIIQYNGKYYKIHSISKPVDYGNAVYIQAIITKSELNI